MLSFSRSRSLPPLQASTVWRLVLSWRRSALTARPAPSRRAARRRAPFAPRARALPRPPRYAWPVRRGRPGRRAFALPALLAESPARALPSASNARGEDTAVLPLTAATPAPRAGIPTPPVRRTPVHAWCVHEDASATLLARRNAQPARLAGPRPPSRQRGARSAPRGRPARPAARRPVWRAPSRSRRAATARPAVPHAQLVRRRRPGACASAAVAKRAPTRLRAWPGALLARRDSTRTKPAKQPPRVLDRVARATTLRQARRRAAPATLDATSRLPAHLHARSAAKAASRHKRGPPSARRVRRA